MISENIANSVKPDASKPTGVRPKQYFPNAFSLGFELEFGSPTIASAQRHQAITRIGELKYDGTVPSGFEIASNVFHFNDFIAGRSNAKYHIWRTFFDTLVALKCSVDSVAGAGMHIHVGRECISPDRIFICNLMLCAWANYTRIIGEREFTQYCRNLVNPSANCAAKGGTVPRSERYKLLNVCPEKTLELRFFKSTISLKAFLKNIQFAMAVFSFAGSVDTTGLADGNPESIDRAWLEFLCYCGERVLTFPVLCQFFALKGFLESAPVEEAQTVKADVTRSGAMKVCASDVPKSIRPDTMSRFICALQAVCASFPNVKPQAMMHALKHITGKDNSGANFISLMSWVHGLCSQCERGNYESIVFE